jgi:hypothetical protein
MHRIVNDEALDMLFHDEVKPDVAEACGIL